MMHAAHLVPSVCVRLFVCVFLVCVSGVGAGAPVTQTGTAKFAGATRHSDAAVCVRVQVATDDDGTVPPTVKSCTLLVNCDDFVMGGSLLDAVKAALTA